MKPLSLWEWHQITFLMSDLKRIGEKINTEKMDQVKIYFETIYNEKEKRLFSFAEQEFKMLLKGTGVIPHPEK